MHGRPRAGCGNLHTHWTVYGLALLKRLDFRTMAARALLRLGLIEKDLLALHWTQLFVTTGTGHIAMFALERECRPLVMIEQRRLPFRGVVAIGAGRDLIRLRELLAVHILVALLALFRCLLEVHIDQLGLEVGWLMAIDACHGPVGALQREGSLVVIEVV